MTGVHLTALRMHLLLHVLQRQIRWAVAQNQRPDWAGLHVLPLGSLKLAYQRVTRDLAEQMHRRRLNTKIFTKRVREW